MNRTGTKIVIRKTGVKAAPIAPVASIEPSSLSENLRSILESVRDILPNEPKIIEKLLALKDVNGTKVFQLKHREYFMQIINMLSFTTIDELTSYFSLNVLDKDIFWKSPIFGPEQSKEFLDAEIFLNRVKVQTGAGRCKHCLSDNTIGMGLQTRGADEGETMFFTCLQCGTKWKSH